MAENPYQSPNTGAHKARVVAMAEMGKPHWIASAFAALSILASLAGNAFVLLVMHSLWSVPAGSSIRPMGIAFAVVLAVVFTPLAACGLAVTAIAIGRKRIYVVPLLFAIVLSLSPIAVSRLYANHIAETNNLTFKP